MIGLAEKTLRSARLTYRLPREEDKPYFGEMLADAAVTEPAGFLPLKSAEALDSFFEGLCQADCGIAILLGDLPIGYVRVYREQPDGAAYADRLCLGLGFVIGRPWQGQGYGTEMLQFITAYLKKYFADYRPVIAADAFIDNPASNRVIEKCGYRYQDDYSMYFDALGREMTCHHYIC